MRAWTRAATDEFCGGCGATIAKGDTLLVLQIAHLAKLRCVACAGPAPPDVPLTPGAARPPLDMTRIGLLSLAWSRDRDPGQEG